MTIGFGEPFNGGNLVEMADSATAPAFSSFDELKAAIETEPMIVSTALLIQAVQTQLQHYWPLPDDDNEIVKNWRDAKESGQGFLVGWQPAGRATETELLNMVRAHRDQHAYLKQALAVLETRLTAEASAVNREDWRARLRRCSSVNKPAEEGMTMDFGATFEPFDGVEPAAEEPRAASSDDYLLRQRKQSFELFCATFAHGGHTARLPPRLVEIFLEGIEDGTYVATAEQRAWLRDKAAQYAVEGGRVFPSSRQHSFGAVHWPQSDPFLDAFAATKAHAAARAASPGTRMNVVITLADAARVFAYRGLNELSRRLRVLADRFEPTR